MIKKYISWNVNGLRAVMNKNFMAFFDEINADVFCIQETKLQAGQLPLLLPGYEQYWDYAEKKGYSGTAVFTKETPLSVRAGLPEDIHNHEGRCLCLEYETHFLVCVYVPNSQDELKRLDYRLVWETDFRNYVSSLKKNKPVIICGDMNVAHECIDLKNDKANHGHSGFTDEERAMFSQLLSVGFTDSFRFLYPECEKYSWWSYRMNSRQKNTGWRIDYFLVSDKIKHKIKDAVIHTGVYGSDHAPVELLIDI